MKIAELKYQSATPSNPSPNTLGLYAFSGTQNHVLYSLVSGGVPRVIGITATGSIPATSVHTGYGVLGTGVFFGGTGNGIVNATGLASPFLWVPYVDSVGNNLAIPAYLLA